MKSQVALRGNCFSVLQFYVQSDKIIERPRDGIGRRRGLKIPR